MKIVKWVLNFAVSVFMSLISKVIKFIMPDCTPAEYLDLKDRRDIKSGGFNPRDVYNEGSSIQIPERLRREDFRDDSSDF